MNRLDRRDAVSRLQGNIHTNHQMCFNNSTGHASTSHWDALDTYPRYSVNEPHGSMDLDVGWKRLSPPAQNKQLNEVEDPDGEPLEIDSEDPELTRKRNELREIEEQIIQKKVAIALKNVEPFVKMTIPGFCDQESRVSRVYEGETLRDRVNVILQQRQSLTILSKVQSPKKLPSLRKESLLQEDHPLKLRVKALMKKRCPDPCVLRTPAKVFDGVSSSKEVNNANNEGFQRFLSILNKGVDMDLLSRIVNDDSEELPNIHSEGKKPSKSQRSNSGASRPSPRRGGSGEDKTETSSRERSHNEGVSLLYEDKRKHDGGDSSYVSTRRSKSPMAEKKKKEETNPKLDEQHEHLQNVLKTLGLDLEVEEMSKLTDRTQERLYGKKHENRKEQESEQMASQTHHSDSSSSSSSSCCSSYSSRSTSRSFSPSPSRHCGSHSRDSSDSRDSKPRLKQGEGHQDEEPQKLRDTEDEGSTYPRPSYQMYPHPHPGAFSSFPAGPLPQYSQSTTLHSGEYSTSSPSYWTYSQGAVPSSFYSSGFSNPQSAYHHFPVTKTVYPQNNNFEDLNLLVNPDLSTSEGQSGSTSGRRCLQVVSRRLASQQTPYLKQLTGARKKRYRPCRAQRKLDSWKRKQHELKQIYESRIQEAVPTLKIPKSSQNDEVQPLEEVKQLTEEEIKANLRKKLEAFNQMAKQKVSQPASSQLLTSVECQDYL